MTSKIISKSIFVLFSSKRKLSSDIIHFDNEIMIDF